MPYIYFRLMAANFDFPLIYTSGSIQYSTVVLPDPENMGIAVGLSLPSFVQAKIYVFKVE